MEDITSSFSRPVVNVRKKPLPWAVKRQIVEFASKHPDVTQGVIASKFGCNRSTVCKILKKKDKFGITGDICVGVPKSKQLDELTYEWIVSMRNANIPLTGTIIKETASQIAQRIGQVHFMPSNEWLKQLCRRYGIPLTVNPAAIHNNNNSPSTPNHNLVHQQQLEKHQRGGSEADEFDEVDDDDEEEDEEEEDAADEVMLADDNFADHCLTDDSVVESAADDVVTLMNNNNNLCPDKMADKMVKFEQVITAFDTIRTYFEQEGTFLGEDLEIIFELEQMCISKRKKKGSSA